MVGSKGTNIIKNYFGWVVFEFDIGRALSEINSDTEQTYLTPYIYQPIIVDLNEKEYEEYNDLANKIDVILTNRNNSGGNSNLKKYCDSRSKLINNAYSKYGALIKILKENPDMDKLIVFCSSRQIEDVQKILNNQGVIPQHRFTQHESSKKTIKNPESEREALLRNFANGTYRALVAIKCLDEGVDVPVAQNAIIRSSTSNPREHVQRRGRILRSFPGKERAVIYDILVFPKDNTKYGSKLINKDIKRYIEFAKNAENSWECLKILMDEYPEYI